MRRFIWSRGVLALAAFIAGAGVALAQGPLHDLPIRLRVADGATTVSFRTTSDLAITSGEQRVGAPPGAYSVHLRDGSAARERFRLFSKTFPLDEMAARDDYLAQWRQRGYEPEVVVMGNRLIGEDGTPFDTRIEWIALVAANSEPIANGWKKKLEDEGQWTWMRSERVAPGKGIAELRNAAGEVLGAWPLPVSIAAHDPIAIANVDTGYWKSNVQTLKVPGRLSLEAGVDARIELFVEMRMEDYLKGVLPAEMPAGWPIEALKAQAVAARSEVVASLGLRHHLDGFDFCMLEHCRAFRGRTADHGPTDEAIDTTRDQILVRDGVPVVTVFSSNCGGWTENNDTVWSAPPNEALRAVSDISKGNTSYTPASYGLTKWFTNPPPAYCSADTAGYRWKKRVSMADLSRVANRDYGVGTVRTIELGERGPSGRLKSIRITGTAKTAEVRKELPIRRVFGGLPSAAFVLTPVEGAYIVTGAGRGHGVGMCQHGARGMAAAGMGYTQILKHYFTGARVERCR